MSTNLYAEYKSTPIVLRQTPTQITYSLVGTDTVSADYAFKGKEAKNILKRYCMWVKYSTNGLAYDDVRELEDDIQQNIEHIKYIQGFLDLDPKHCKVFVF